MKVSVLLGCPEEFKPAARYAISTLLDQAGVFFEFAELPILHADARPILFYGKHEMCPAMVDIFIPAKSNCEMTENLSWIWDDLCILLASDIVAATFNWLVRWKHRETMIGFPWVNAYTSLLIDLLRQVAHKKGNPLLRMRPWPEDYEHAVALSHDVDQVELSNPANGLHLLRHAFQSLELRGILRGIFYTVMGFSGRARYTTDPAWHFEHWMELEAKHGFRSSFYFVSTVTHSGRDPAYDILSHRLQAMLNTLHTKGWEIGVHGSYQSYRDTQCLRREREKMEEIIGASIIGIRQHYLQLSLTDTFRAQEKAGYLYDSTLGYRTSAGFRAGVATPFHPFDLNQSEAIDLLELPLICMDGAYFWHLDYSPDEVLRHIKTLLNLSRQYNGLLILLWHQRVWCEKKYPGWRSVYESVVQHLSQMRSAWIATEAQIAKWWLAREEVTMKRWQRSNGESTLFYETDVSIDGLVLELILPREADVIIHGVEADLTWDDLTVNISIPHLAARQSFSVHIREK
jgi:peptidoglycan/xylan/chitin deacetylase (PgdA/CDA1 family)